MFGVRPLRTRTVSLTVNAFKRGANGSMDLLDVDHSDELAGFEVCRQKLWGHASVRALGLVVLPSLSAGDIYAEGDAIPKLEAEVKTLLEHLAVVAVETGYDEAFITHRCQNILGAV